MVIKFLQLNILKGRFLDKVINFIKENGFDIVHLQEVTGATISFNHADCFEKIKKTLNYNGEIAVTMNLVDDKNSYFANATFFKKNFSVQKKEIIWLKRFKEISDYKNRRIQDDPRCALALDFMINNQPVKFINTHLTWGPTSLDKKFKLLQAKKLYNYVKLLKIPFILSGDFNVNPRSQIVTWFNCLARNLVMENNITNTLNPRTHYVQKLFPPGLTVDFLYVAKTIKIKTFRLVDEVDLSDHFGLAGEFTV